MFVEETPRATPTHQYNEWATNRKHKTNPDVVGAEVVDVDDADMTGGCLRPSPLTVLVLDAVRCHSLCFRCAFSIQRIRCVYATPWMRTSVTTNDATIETGTSYVWCARSNSLCPIIK